MTYGFGAALRFQRKASAADGRVQIYRWRLDMAAVPSCDLARHIGAAYVNAKSRWSHPGADTLLRLPPQGTTTRKGDFGEIIAATLYTQRLGRYVPFQKLELKPVAGATLQGADVLGLTLVDPDDPGPVLTEVKTRPTISPGEVLKEIATSIARTTEDYLVSAWAAGVSLMESHPDDQKAYALSAAQHLARLVDPTGSYPPHDRHAVVVTATDNLTVGKVNQYWGSDPPVSELHVIVVDDLVNTMNSLYDAAGRLTYGDLASAAPHLLGERAHLPGLSAPVSSTAAAELVHAAAGSRTLALCEAALWHLADWDGMGTARARAVQEVEVDPVVRGLAAILVGAIARARTALRETELAPFSDAVQAAWARTLPAAELVDRTAAIASTVTPPDLAQAITYIGAAVAHRLPRHPATMTEAAGATGPNVRHAVERMERFGRHALWPSQAAAVGGGLLDRGHPSLAIRMPTSAGKTALIELLVADTLDLAGDPVVAVLAPTKALVAQLTGDLRGALPEGVAVRSSHGGLDFDTDEPSAKGILAERGVAVMTPERFDLEWRRAATGDGLASVDGVRLLVVDEAHLLSETFRGARVELAVARALRRDIRVVLVSSQFPNPQQLADWLDGDRIESDWSPTWLRRFVYYRSADKAVGLRQAESGDAAPVLTLKPSTRSSGDGCPRERPHEAAALAEIEHGDGLVVIYANEKARIANLVEAVRSKFGEWPAATPALLDLARAIESVDLVAARLLQSGIGLHHGDLPRPVRQAVETAARKNLLRCVVCTPTLLEGVDFPTRTVVAAYPPKTHKGNAEIARLRNLAGRAGRGGRFTSGTLVVMADDEAAGKKWLRAFRAQLPPTRSGLARALDQLRQTAKTLHVLDLGDEQRPVDAVDGLVLAAIAEGAVTDGELRAALEEALGRTLWYATTHPSTRDYILDVATRRAAHVARAVGDRRWSRSFYRSGLPVGSCIAVRDALAPHADRFERAMESKLTDPDEWLLWLAAAIAPQAKVLAHWTSMPWADMHDALGRWLRGEPLEVIAVAHPEVWPAIANDLETLLPWVLTGAIELAATHVGRTDLRDLAHRRLAISRIRYGVPRAELCGLVRGGLDRALVSRLASEHDAQNLSGRIGQSLEEYIVEQAWRVSEDVETATPPVLAETQDAATTGAT